MSVAVQEFQTFDLAEAFIGGLALNAASKQVILPTSKRTFVVIAIY